MKMRFYDYFERNDKDPARNLYCDLLHFLVAITASLALASCTTIRTPQKYVSPDKSFSVAVEGGVLTYRGLLMKRGVDQAEKYLAEHPSVSVLAIESQGGEVTEGMRLGDLVLARSMDVRVIGSICASSCANYVFVSGRQKFIEPGALLTWHGSPLRPQDMPITATVVDSDGHSESKEYKGEALLEYLKRPEIAISVERDRKEQMEFFRARRVDGRITVFGQEIGCDCQWTLTVEDMGKFGVDGVYADSSYPNAAPLLKELSVVTLRLKDYPGHVSGGKD
ncbi:hypothetical protein [Pseudoxanthomonas japonensis]|uniref:hypothetical protein n=1 Tax=Pseudoxanthomonas japonensis TaxID=69284 RepID=UPI0037486D49